MRLDRCTFAYFALATQKMCWVVFMKLQRDGLSDGIEGSMR